MVDNQTRGVFVLYSKKHPNFQDGRSQGMHLTLSGLVPTPNHVTAGAGCEQLRWGCEVKDYLIQRNSIVIQHHLLSVIYMGLSKFFLSPKI